MMEMYGRAIVEDRLRPRKFAEIATYVRNEYGPGIGPAFLFAGMANGGVAGKPRKQWTTSRGVIRTLAKAMRALVPGNGRKAKAPSPAR